jgi:hypothetical protein
MTPRPSIEPNFDGTRHKLGLWQLVRDFIPYARASAALGRAIRFERQGRADDALREYKRGLSIIGVSRARHESLISSTFTMLALYAESLASRRHLTGLTHAELTTTLALILEDERTGQDASGASLASQISFLEHRISMCTITG